MAHGEFYRKPSWTATVKTSQTSSEIQSNANVKGCHPTDPMMETVAMEPPFETQPYSAEALRARAQPGSP